MPEATPDDLARIRKAVQFRDRCVEAALKHYRRVDLQPIDTYARAAFDAMEDLIRQDERGKINGEGGGVVEEEVRPRFGTLTRRDGTRVPLVFHPTEVPGTFLALHAGTERRVWMDPGDRVRADVLGAGQSITFELTSTPEGTP